MFTPGEQVVSVAAITLLSAAFGAAAGPLVAGRVDRHARREDADREDARARRDRARRLVTEIGAVIPALLKTTLALRLTRDLTPPGVNWTASDEYEPYTEAALTAQGCMFRLEPSDELRLALAQLVDIAGTVLETPMRISTDEGGTELSRATACAIQLVGDAERALWSEGA